jgi:hypothetical protein
MFKLSNLLYASVLLLIFCFSVFADTIKLKDGSVIKGKVVGFRDGQFIVIVGSGSRMRQMNFYADEVESIEFDSAVVVVDQYNNSINKLEPSENIPIKSKVESTPQLIQTDKVKVTEQVIPSDKNLKQENKQVESSNQSSSNTREVISKTNDPKPKIEPVRLKVKVLADNTANGWTSVGWVVKKGQKIRIIGKGQVYLGRGNFSGPEGMKSLPDPDKLIPQAPTGALIAVIGDDNNDFIFIGAENEFVAEREGVLFLGVNEGYLDDNSGAFDVVVEIYP